MNLKLVPSLAGLCHRLSLALNHLHGALHLHQHSLGGSPLEASALVFSYLKAVRLHYRVLVNLLHCSKAALPQALPVAATQILERTLRGLASRQ